MSGCRCGGTVSLVSRHHMERRLAKVNPGRRPAALQAALGWLAERHPGLSCFEGIRGRPYREEERYAIARDLPALVGLPCPFQTIEGCLLREAGLQHPLPLGKPYMWLPALVALVWDRQTVRNMVDAREVADVKLGELGRYQLDDVLMAVRR